MMTVCFPSLMTIKRCFFQRSVRMSSMFIADVLATMMLIWLGDGVVANVLLKHSKGNGSGWIVITAGWCFAVAMSGYVGGAFGGFNNPAVALAFAITGDVPWSSLPVHFIATTLGGLLGAVLVWLQYLPHWAPTEDQGLKLAVFSTGPAIRNAGANLLSEVMGTACLLLCVYGLGKSSAGASTGMGAVVGGFMVWSMGLSLGGPTGYAINPARDLGPRIAHAILPIPGKGGSDWEYSWIPVIGPCIGAVIGAIVWKMLLTVFP
jgi:glycerol uptake facilitator protein